MFMNRNIFNITVVDKTSVEYAVTYAVTLLQEERQVTDCVEEISREYLKEEHRQPGDILNDLWRGFDVEESEEAKHHTEGEGNEKSKPKTKGGGNEKGKHYMEGEGNDESKPDIMGGGNEKAKHHIEGDGNKENESDCVIRKGKDKEKKKLRFKLPEKDLQQEARKGKNY